MKPSELKTLIKEACKEAFREEMKEILLEAIKSPKTIVQEIKKESRQVVKENQEDQGIPKTQGEMRNAYMSLMDNMIQGKTAFTTEDIPGQQQLGPIPSNTVGEGTRLPEGEVPMDLIMKLTGGQ
jgi:hypothetical protein